MRKAVIVARTRGIWGACLALMIGISVSLAALYVIDDLTGWIAPRWMFRLLPGLGMAAMLILHLYGKSRRRDSRHQPGTPAGDVPEDVQALVRQGKKIRAIKTYQKLHGEMTLKEAKAFIDSIADGSGLPLLSRRLRL